MSADSPASGLPQEAVDAAYHMFGSLRGWSADETRDLFREVITAALPFLRQQWEAELPDPNGLAHLRTANALFEERAKVAGLREAVDKVRELFAGGPDTSCRTAWHGGVEYVEVPMDDLRVALLPDVQADDRGTTTPTPATTCAACGTTRTICDAGLNTYDTRCCEQCGHGVT